MSVTSHPRLRLAISSTSTNAHHPTLPSTHHDSWRMLGRMGIVRKGLHHYKSFQNGALNPASSPDCCLLTDPASKRELVEYNVEYVKKYDEDLNTTLIFVCYSPSHCANHLIHFCRPACSPQSAPLLSSTSIRTSNLIPTSNPLPSSSLSTNLSFLTRPPPFCLLTKPSERDRHNDPPDVCGPPSSTRFSFGCTNSSSLS